MTNEHIPIDVRNFINGSRFIYMEKMITKLNFAPELLLIYPTGSSRLTSDKDIQISIDINKYRNISVLHRLIKYIHNIIEKGNKEWRSRDIERLLDIHFYPPTLMNFVYKRNGDIKSPYVQCSNTKTQKTTKLCIFVPQLSSKELITKFHRNEYQALQKNVNENTKYFYKTYDRYMSKCLSDLIDC